MRTKKYTYEKKKGNTSLPFFIILAGVLGIILFIIIGGLKTVGQHTRNNQTTEMTTLPNEIKKQVEKSSTLSASLRVPILMYHYVEYVKDEKDTIRQSLNIIPLVFEKQIQTLKNDGYTFLTPQELGKIIDGKRELPKKPIILSFDDGYRDFYTDVFPLLQKHTIPAVVYVIPGFLDTPNYMYAWQVEAIAKSELIEIGAHTMHHVYLKGMPENRAKWEIEESKKTIEEQFHTQVYSFAYPYGAFDEHTVRLVENAGFSTAFSTVPGIIVTQTNRLFLYRIRPGRKTEEDLLNYLKQDSFKPY